MDGLGISKLDRTVSGRTVKVLHLIAGDLNGGAARGAYWLHLALRELGVKSRVLTNSRETLEDPTVTSTLQTPVQKLRHLLLPALGRLPLKLYPKRKKIIFSTGFEGIDITKFSAYLDSDIVHMHWINGLVSIKGFKQIKKPIIWTMRDMWPMTGGCHHALDCKGYETGCGRCPQLNSNFSHDLSRIVVKRKQKYFPSGIKVIGISKWLSDKGRGSKILGKYNIRTIHNNISTREFFPVEKTIARKTLGLNTDKKIILTGAQYLNDSFKGFDKFLAALRRLDNSKYFLCFFGKLNPDSIKGLGFEYKNFGFLHDTISLRLLYSAAHVFVAPSLMEAFGKTLAESMACGTPVVCFDATGPKDIVAHKVSGYKAKPFDEEDLAYGIKWILSSPNREEISKNAREKVIKDFDSPVIAQKYMRLYEEVWVETY